MQFVTVTKLVLFSAHQLPVTSLAITQHQQEPQPSHISFRLLPTPGHMLSQCLSRTSRAVAGSNGHWFSKLSAIDGVHHAHPSPRRYTTFSSSDHADRTKRLLDAKAKAGLTYDKLASKLGITNTYAAQILLGQTKLSAATAAKLQAALPISEQDIEDMKSTYPMRGFDDEILKEPNVYRTYEAITHYGEAIKSIINEQCGDGIMSAIDFYCDVGTTTGVNGEKRVVITFNGKFLPHIEQKEEDNTAKSPRD